ncbi:uncharacterized protein C8A04DRAFT_31230 [Dichotomopilus funicola]|uniref:Uncharacterized protein n=1 Tax=Dichotomopilus funicola TaxID=1934379 RepID=A0AAN6UXY8_9PEZI|nr:hypothetical protein C8A04DRAFT_31230 [Dichotomopilus funicola]
MFGGTMRDLPEFCFLAPKAMMVLRELPDGQLHTFSWDLGTCVPSEILGPDGWVTHHHPSLRSLSLTTDPYCEETGSEIDLSSLRKLQNLTWRGPRAKDIPALSDAIRGNLPQLQNVGLDLVDWPGIQLELTWDIEEDIDEESWFTHTVLGLTSGLPTVAFEAIRDLSLSQVPLGAAMAHAINFNTLSSLRLRKCPLWDDFLKSAMELKVPIKLKTLELQYNDDVTQSERGDVVAGDFLGVFEGLEELFFCNPKAEIAVELWHRVVHQQATLRRFVHHQRLIGSSGISKQDMDFPPDPSMLWPQGYGKNRDIPRVEEDYPQNPLASLNLEFIRLSCYQELLESFGLPFMKKVSWKILHICQSHTDIVHGVTTSDIYDSTEHASPGRLLRLGTRRFAQWIFGPQRIQSL